MYFIQSFSGTYSHEMGMCAECTREGLEKASLMTSIVSLSMMTSSNENIFRVTGHLCGEFTDHRWIPRTKASNSELCGFLWSAPQ